MYLKIESVLARAAVLVLLVGVRVFVRTADLVRWLARLKQRDVNSERLQVLIAGTFYNDGWFHSHIMPLVALDEIEAVTVVCDAPLDNLEKVRYVCPPRWFSALVGRAIARFVVTTYATRKYGPDVLMGYHIMPNALLCLMVARLFGRRSVYQMTGGPVQIIGGGIGSENALLRRQQKPSWLREALMVDLVRQFDHIIVRGQSAITFLKQIGVDGRSAVIPGSVDTRKFKPNGRLREYDLVSVGRLAKVKRFDRMLQIIARLVVSKPEIRLAIIGDGPLREQLEEQARRLNIAKNVVFMGQRHDVPIVLGQARAFIITSENEGMSIAMMEAMAAGLPPIVPDIGDLDELLVDGQTGIFIDPADPTAAASEIEALLEDKSALNRLATNAQLAATKHAGVEAVAARWRAQLVESGS